jgi:hypothetical protein
MMFAAVVGHCCGRATPFLRNAPQRQSMEIVRGETIYRNRNAVQTNPATSEFALKACASRCAISPGKPSPGCVLGIVG